MRMSNEQRQSRSGRKVTLAVICLKNSSSLYCFRSQILGFPLTWWHPWSPPWSSSPPWLLPRQPFPPPFHSQFWTPTCFRKRGHASWTTRWNHLSKTSLVSTLLSTTTSFFTLPCTNQSLICARMSLRNFWTWNIQLMERSQVERKEKYALSSVETKRVRPYSCFLVKLSGG